jgi:hypothetical protein
MPLRTRPRLALACAAAALACAGGTSVVLVPPSSDDSADYTLLSARIVSGPAVIGEGQSAQYDVSYTFERHATGGAVAPWVVGVDDDGAFRLDDDDLAALQSIFGGLSDPPGVYQGSGSFTLRCENDEIKGGLGGSAEGHEDILGVNEAEVVARVQRGFENPTQAVESAPKDVACH